MEFEERRAAPRQPTDVNVEIWEGSKRRFVLALDASPGGLCIADAGQRDRDYVTVDVIIPGGHRYSALCRVAWSEGPLVGLEFVDCPEALRRRIQENVERREPAQPELNLS